MPILTDEEKYQARQALTNDLKNEGFAGQRAAEIILKYRTLKNTSVYTHVSRERKRERGEGENTCTCAYHRVTRRKQLIGTAPVSDGALRSSAYLS